MEGPGQVGDGRRRHRPQQQDIGTRRRQASLQRRLEHVTGNPRVLADQNPALALLAKCHAGRPTKLEHEIRGNWKLADTPTNTVGTEIFSSHDQDSLIAYSFSCFDCSQHAHHIDSFRHIMNPQDVRTPGDRQGRQGETAI
ncbi:hypothetical protein D3C80_1568850 [compost metagenome]